MDVFLARQPIFDLKGNVYGYEILYRDSEANCFTESDADYATSNVLTRTFVDFGIAELTCNKKAFINFTENLLRSDVATIFPKKFLVVEILENVIIDDKILEKCKQFKKLGYTIAIDDFIYQPRYDELLRFVDIVKIDFRATPPAEISEIIKKYKRPGLCFLAEKVETREEYNSAVNMGFCYFQGYFFAKPEMSSRKKFTPYKESRMRLIVILNSGHPEFDDISGLIESDLAFSYDILRLANSAYYGQISELKSIRSALVLLGINEIKKWLYLAFISEIRQDQPEEIVNISMIRARFLEGMAIRSNNRKLSSELLTLGMFSTIDLLLGEPISEALEELHFSKEISDVLSGNDTTSFMARCYHIALEYEKGNWDEAKSGAAEINLTVGELNDAYVDAIKWVQLLAQI